MSVDGEWLSTFFALPGDSMTKRVVTWDSPPPLITARGREWSSPTFEFCCIVDTCAVSFAAVLLPCWGFWYFPFGCGRARARNPNCLSHRPILRQFASLGCAVDLSIFFLVSTRKGFPRLITHWQLWWPSLFYRGREKPQVREFSCPRVSMLM